MSTKTSSAVLSQSGEYIIVNEQTIDLTEGATKILLAPTRFIKTTSLNAKEQSQVLALLNSGQIPIVITK